MEEHPRSWCNCASWPGVCRRIEISSRCCSMHRAAMFIDNKQQNPWRNSETREAQVQRVSLPPQLRSKGAPMHLRPPDVGACLVGPASPQSLCPSEHPSGHDGVRRSRLGGGQHCSMQYVLIRHCQIQYDNAAPQLQLLPVLDRQSMADVGGR
jgi:hypothetical protein